MVRTIFFAFLIINFCACAKKKEVAVTAVTDSSLIALQLPSKNTMDFSTGTAFGESVAESLALASKINYGFAKAAVALTSLSLAVRLSVPFAVLKQALLQTPSYQENGKWLWTFDTTVASVDYSTELTGENSDGQNAFEVFISRSPKDSNNCCDSFLWYAGTATEDNSEGVWTFYDPETPEESTQTATVAWENFGDQDKKLVFTMLKIPDASSGWKPGGYVSFEVMDDSAAMAVVKDIESTAKTVVTWSMEDLSGSLETENGQIYCWNDLQENATCPE